MIDMFGHQSITCLLLSCYILMFLIADGYGQSQTCQTTSGQSGLCSKVSECLEFNITQDITILKDFQTCGRLLACCPSHLNFKIIKNLRREPCTSGACLLADKSYCGKIAASDFIVNGVNAKFGTWPWMVALFGDNGGGQIVLYCGGTLISERYVLTAAQCVRSGITLDHVNIGDLIISEDPDVNPTNQIAAPRVQIIRPEEIIMHESYESQCQHCDDIALIRLEKPAILIQQYVVPICIPMNLEEDIGLPKSKFSGDLFGQIAGWGSRTNVQPDHLQVADVSLDQSAYCQALKIVNNYPPGAVLCAGDVCSVESGGGPLIVTNKFDTQKYIIGVGTIKQFKCGINNTQSVYSDIEYHRDWIIGKLKP